MPYRKTKQKMKKTKREESFVELKIAKNRGICKHSNKLFVRNA